MNEKSIVIITGTDGHLGTGHFQRMCTLAYHLNLTSSYNAKIVIKSGNPAIPPQVENFISPDIPSTASLVIRDMRDSTEEDIRLLKKTAPVLVIDDTGPGRGAADFIIALLPSPVSANPSNGMFIYGYNFINSIRNMSLHEFIKDIDVSIYAGYDPDMDYVERLLQAIPPKASVVLFNKNRPVELSGKGLPIGAYADTLLRSRVLITHFGITMYEGELAGCTVVLVNPSPYHSELTRLAGRKLELIPAGEYQEINHKLIHSVVSANLKEKKLRIISSRSINERINISLDYLISHINRICNN